MATITFDTLKFVRRLKEAGFNEQQAEALSDAQKESLTEIIEDRLAAKKDLKELELTLKADLKTLEMKMEGELRLIKWMMGFVLAGIAALILKSFFA